MKNLLKSRNPSGSNRRSLICRNLGVQFVYVRHNKACSKRVHAYRERASGIKGQRTLSRFSGNHSGNYK